ncbi:hypothetical protein T10_13046 [Trichinella papuae]|uniref:Uncharacterized protein n=1 Tax=Trichinella papuae TaxID=268474 RepID=A0A0V1MJ80_9BILA|nr:hypothetical protein T10_13046 [Trichinella papuae]
MSNYLKIQLSEELPKIMYSDNQSSTVFIAISQSEALRSMINSSNSMLSHVPVGVEKAHLQVELNLEKFGFG